MISKMKSNIGTPKPALKFQKII